MSAGVVQSIGKRIMGAAVCGLQVDGFPEFGGGFGVASQLLQQAAAHEAGGQKIGPQRFCGLKLLHGFLGSALPVQRQT